MSTGGPAAYLVRMNAPRPGWQQPLKGWMPKVTHHCLCRYSLSLDTPHVQMRSYTSGVLVHSVFCRHMDVTQAMEYNEREKYSTMLLIAWIAKWLCVFPEGRDELPEGGPQQLPDSGRYRPRPEQQTINDVYHTEAKAREK